MSRNVALPPPGGIICAEGMLSLNANRETKVIAVANGGDRPIQVGSHYHFFEVNRALRFDRAETFGFRLDIPAGTAVRFEPGDTKSVTLVALGGTRQVRGLNSLVDGSLDDATCKQGALDRLTTAGFES
ncbi:MAG: urease subunit beta [Leptolyngbya sp. SIO3F4]|nr:urease subunit beta [Leptolyngbya sp. SIO3F4]